MDPTTTITFSVATIVFSAVLLYIILRLGKLQDHLKQMQVALKATIAVAAPPAPAPALQIAAPTLVADSPGAAMGIGEPSSITSTGAIMRNTLRAASTALSTAQASTDEPQAASPVFIAAAPAGTGAGFGPSPAVQPAWETSPMNGSNPAVAVVVLTPASIPPGLS